MSYEGFDVFICANGHISEYDAYNGPDRGEGCPHCGQPYVDYGMVDETNGLPYPVTFQMFQKTPEKFIVISGKYKGKTFCSRKVVEEATFEMVKLDHYIELEDGNYIVDSMKPLDVSEEE